ncbi:MAG: hypothetical protein Q9182_004842 [Xanthomendoza sp. 2 TL-2023]
MICHRCLRLRTTLRYPVQLASQRLYSIRRSDLPPATSTSAAQPFSTPFTPSPYLSTSPTHPQKQTTGAKTIPSSSLKVGTPLKGLAFEKNKEPPVAREDEAYPEWLWGLLGSGKFGVRGGEEMGGGGDAFSKSAKQRRLASKSARRSASSPIDAIESAPEVPIYQQSTDLPSAPQNMYGKEQTMDMEAGERARGAREELGRAMRGERRRGIKEANFLKEMG